MEFASASLAGSHHNSLFTVLSYPGCRAAGKKPSDSSWLAGWLGSGWAGEPAEQAKSPVNWPAHRGAGPRGLVVRERGADAANGHSSPDLFQLKAISAVTAAMIIVFIIHRNKPPARPWPGFEKQGH